MRTKWVPLLRIMPSFFGLHRSPPKRLKLSYLGNVAANASSANESFTRFNLLTPRVNSHHRGKTKLSRFVFPQITNMGPRLCERNEYSYFCGKLIRGLDRSFVTCDGV